MRDSSTYPGQWARFDHGNGDYDLITMMAVQVTELGPLAACTLLRKLAFSDTKVTGMAALASCPLLLHVDCTDSRVTDLAALVAATQLRKLCCSHTRVADLSALAACSGSLEELYCR